MEMFLNNVAESRLHRIITTVSQEEILLMANNREILNKITDKVSEHIASYILMTKMDELVSQITEDSIIKATLDRMGQELVPLIKKSLAGGKDG